MIFYKLTCVKITVETIPKLTLEKAFSFNFSLEDKCTLLHPVPKFRSCHKDIMVTTGRAHCIHNCIYIYTQQTYLDS